MAVIHLLIFLLKFIWKKQQQKTPQPFMIIFQN